jgi:hypothetical protein
MLTLFALLLFSFSKSFCDCVLLAMAAILSVMSGEVLCEYSPVARRSRILGGRSSHVGDIVKVASRHYVSSICSISAF